MATTSPMCAAASRTSANAVGSARASRARTSAIVPPVTAGAAPVPSDTGAGGAVATSRRAMAEAEATASMQPTFPHTHGSSGPPRTRTCPMSPAAPSAPWCSTPSRVIRPPPIPVPTFTNSSGAWSAGSALASPSARRLTSFSRIAGHS